MDHDAGARGTAPRLATVLFYRDVSRYAFSVKWHGCRPWPTGGRRHDHLDGRQAAATHHRGAGHPARRPADHRTAQRGRHRRPGPGRRHPDQQPAGHRRTPRRRAPGRGTSANRGGPGCCGGSGSSVAGSAPTSRSPSRPTSWPTCTWSAGRWSPPGWSTTPRVNVTSGQVTLMGLAGRTNARIVSGPVEALGVAGELDPGDGLRRGDPRRQRGRPGARPHRLRRDHLRPGQPPAQRDPARAPSPGAITVRVREDSDLSVHLHTTSGRITSGFPQVAAAASDSGR